MNRTDVPLGDPQGGLQRHVFQFSMFSLLAALTVVSLMFAAYFGIGRAFGMTNVDMMRLGLMRFIYMVPMLVVWAIGLSLALRRRTGDRRSVLLIIAFAGMIATAFFVDVSQMVLIHFLTSGGGDVSEILLSLVGVVSVALNTIWWILILVAIFAGGTNEPAEYHNSDPQSYPPSGPSN